MTKQKLYYRHHLVLNRNPETIVLGALIWFVEENKIEFVRVNKLDRLKAIYYDIELDKIEKHLQSYANKTEQAMSIHKEWFEKNGKEHLKYIESLIARVYGIQTLHDNIFFSKQYRFGIYEKAEELIDKVSNEVNKYYI